MHTNRSQLNTAEFSDWIANRLAKCEALQVVDAIELVPHAKRAHPTDKHFLRLSFILGIAEQCSAVHTLGKEIRHSVLSMDAYAYERLRREV
jgi:4,5-DOPA dioxygenase extradiol